MQAVVGDDPFDAALADGDVLLEELLRDDVGGAVGIEEALGDDAADDLGGASVIGFGAGGARLEGARAALGEGGQQLVIALATVAELIGDLGDGQLGAFAQYEHGEVARDEVVRA